MPNYETQIQGPNLGGLSQGYSSVQRGGSSQAVAELLTTAVGYAAKAYGSSEAKKAGKAIGGEETYEAAGLVADQASEELAGLAADKSTYQGRDVTKDQAKDLRNQVFGRVLTNQKRIQSAVDRGLISSTEATARLSVLRNEALSNPLIAPYQNELDNALYTTTGGSGTTFAATAEENRAAAKKKGELAALEETQKQVSGMIQTGVATNEKQALNYISQLEAQKRQMAFLDEKRATLGLTSQEVYAANQTFQTQQATEGYSAIVQWQASGGDANQKQQLQLKLVNDGELTKQSIRARAFSKDGQLLIQAEQLAAQIAEVDKRTKEFTDMLNDQSGTQKLTDQIAQMNAAMDLKGTQINVDLSKRLPVMYALKDQPVAQKWFIDTVTGTNKLKNEWMLSTNPIMKVIAGLPDSELNDKVSAAGEKFLNGGALDNTDSAIASTTLLQRGGAGSADTAYSNNPEQTLKALTDIPFTIKGVANNDEWKRKASTPEGKDQLAAVIQGAASRVVLASAYKAGAQESSSRYGGQASLPIPTEIVVRREEPSAVANKMLMQGATRKPASYATWKIDTKGVPVSDEYRSEVANAYRLGESNPEVWQEDFATIDAWISHLFTRKAN